MTDTTAPRKRGPYAKTRKRREQIGRAALALVNDKGHENVAVADVVELSGLPEATVLYHCPTRDHLFVAALEQADLDSASEQLRRTGDPAEGIRALAAADRGHRNRVRLFTVQSANASAPGHPAHEWFMARAAMVRRTWGELLVSLQQEGRAHPDIEPEQFARQMAAVWDGLQVQWLVSPDFDLPGEVADAFRALTRADSLAARRAIELAVADL
ncbi:TetR/AcrR family transcriptional regulator [Tessaracoccus sp. G1721]